ncbi:MAG: ERAP1-like C-terminal domain-containing protein [Pseudomonadota bacterium]
MRSTCRHDTRDAFAHFDSITYNKGASVLKQLAHFVGDEAFQRGVRRYLREFSGKTTRLDDFVAALTASSGLDLAAWSREWLFTAGVNTFAVAPSCDGGQLRALTIAQSASEEQPRLRTHRVQLGLYGIDDSGAVTTLETLPVTVSGAETTVDLPDGLPCPQLVYPNTGDWGYARVLLDAQTAAQLVDHIGAVTDPLQRSMFWQSLWDMARDAALPLQEFLGLALRELDSEADERVVSLVLDRVAQGVVTLKRGLPASNALLDEYVGPLESLLWRRAQSAEDTTTRMLWFDAYLDIVHTEAGLARLPGAAGALALDVRRQWQTQIVLATYGAGDSEAGVEALLAEGQSDYAQRKAMVARAALPEAAVKDRWLTRLHEGDDLTLAQARDVMLYLFPAHQAALTERYAGRVLDALPALTGERNDAYLRAYNRLLPKRCTPVIGERLDAAIGLGEALHPESLRALRVHRQEQQICTRMLERAGAS